MTGLAFLSGAPGPGEVLVVFIAVLILFGPRRLPDFARRMGRLLAELRKASDDFRNELMRMDRPAPAPPPLDHDPDARAVADASAGEGPGQDERESPENPDGAGQEGRHGER